MNGSLLNEVCNDRVGNERVCNEPVLNVVCCDDL